MKRLGKTTSPENWECVQFIRGHMHENEILFFFSFRKNGMTTIIYPSPTMKNISSNGHCGHGICHEPGPTLKLGQETARK